MIKSVSRVREASYSIGWIIASLFGLLSGASVVLSAIATFSGTSVRSLSALGLLGIIFVVFGLWFWSLHATVRWLRARARLLGQYSGENNIELLGIQPITVLSPTLRNLGSRDQVFGNCFGSSDYMYGEYSFARYQQSRYGESKTETIFHAVALAKLPRPLPNVFFDAKQTRDKEYEHQFNHAQKHSLEGNFDDYFDAYFPPGYTLDSLSFITPEVMEVLIEAKDYDIEIYANHVYLYAPLRTMPEQIEEMLACVQNIRTKLLNNIITYRDQRVAYKDGRTSVSGAGLQLRPSLDDYYFGLSAGLLLTVIGVAVCISGVFIWQLLAVGVALTASCTYTIHKEHKYWRYLDSLNKTIS